MYTAVFHKPHNIFLPKFINRTLKMYDADLIVDSHVFVATGSRPGSNSLFCD